MRRLITGLALAAIVGFIWIGTFPTKAECRASGRVVDPTERHCQAAGGYEQLQEHVWFHAAEVLAGVGVLAAVAYAGHRLYRPRRSREVAKTA